MIRTKMPFVMAFIVLAVATTWSSPGVMSVQVKMGQLRETPSFLGTVVAVVNYGDQVDVLRQQGDWLEVRSPGGKSGWIHQSSLTSKRIVLNAGTRSARTAASADELALAGKGFNSAVEAQFKASHRDIDYTWVNKMEHIQISPREIMGFLDQGGIRPQRAATAKGGAK
jgi:SH3-like domain-containing protein